MPKIIIGLVGRQGSGKGAAATILKEKYGAVVFRYSSLLNDILDKLAIERTRDHLIKLSETLRHAFGEDVLTYAMAQQALNAATEIVIVDGIRRIEDMAALEPLPVFKLIEISAPAKIRYERMIKRGEKVGETGMTWEEFTVNEQAPTEITIPSVAARAWQALDNSGTPEELEDKINEMMKILKINT